MITFFKSFKSLASGLLVVLFVGGLTFSSCSGQQSGDTDSEATEQESTETSEHPEESNEHPSDDASEEHPNDTTSATWKEDHPSDSGDGDEHPSDN